MTNRQREVGNLILEGYGNKEIGEILDIKEKTVKFHVENIYKKANVDSRARFIVKMYKEMMEDSSYGSYINMEDLL